MQKKRLKKTLFLTGLIAFMAFSALAAEEVVTMDDIQAARELIADELIKTPCVYSRSLSQLTGADIFLKVESLQTTGSFKERGALNKLYTLTEAQRKKGVIAASTGNHAQGVSYHASRLGIPSTIIMPLNTPENKIERARMLGAEIILHGDTFDDSVAHAIKMSEKSELSFIHAYNDPSIIAGQGTAAIEMLEDVPQLDMLVIPVGGGGLISGCSVAAKSIKPDIKIYGVEASAYSAMKQKLHHEPVDAGGHTLAEGMAVKQVGDHPYSLIKDRIEEILVVDEQHIEKAVAVLAEEAKLVAEGAGATPLAALLQYPDYFKGKNVGLLISGGNIDAYELAMVLLRALAHTGKLVQIAIEVTDHPDKLGEITSIMDQKGVIIREIRNNEIFSLSDMVSPEMIFVVETHNWDHVNALLQELADHDLNAKVIR